MDQDGDKNRETWEDVEIIYIYIMVGHLYRKSIGLIAWLTVIALYLPKPSLVLARVTWWEHTPEIQVQDEHIQREMTPKEDRMG